MTTIKERPILFSAPMVRAILEGMKTATRRVVNVQPFDLTWSRRDHRFEYMAGRAAKGDEIDGFYAYSTRSGGEWSAKCPYGQPGDRLWVRETWSDVNLQGAPGIAYRADDDVWDLMEEVSFLDQHGAFNYEDPRAKPYQFACWSEDLLAGTEGRWRPSIHMPRWVSRILLEIIDVRVERLQDISEDQAKAEGLLLEDGQWSGAPGLPSFGIPVPAFAHLWISINGVEGWNANPWVWVVEFKRVTP